MAKCCSILKSLIQKAWKEEVVLENNIEDLIIDLQAGSESSDDDWSDNSDDSDSDVTGIFPLPQSAGVCRGTMK